MAQNSIHDQKNVRTLSILTLAPNKITDAVRHLSSLSPGELEEFLKLADSHHVVLRSLSPLLTAATLAGNATLASWCTQKIAEERARIANALSMLERVTQALEAAECRTTVMKSLDHWPDLGNDLDLYTSANEQSVVNLMTHLFGAHIQPRSWGDRLANKWNFDIPGLREAIEVHARRLGQTGEHMAMAERFVSRRMSRMIDGHTFYVPAPEERIIVATLQRMYRHFYFRVCDIANTMLLVESGAIDFNELKRGADIGGIWKGICSFLKIVSDYVEEYRGTPVALPAIVLQTAPFGGEKIYVRDRFIRVPIMPEGAELYTDQVTRAALRGDVPATFRLTLLPPLASVAALSYKLTGSDKGIW